VKREPASTPIAVVIQINEGAVGPQDDGWQEFVGERAAAQEKKEYALSFPDVQLTF